MMLPEALSVVPHLSDTQIKEIKATLLYAPLATEATLSDTPLAIEATLPDISLPIEVEADHPIEAM